MPIPKPTLPRNRGRWAATLGLLVAAAVVVVIVVSNGNTPSHNTGAGTTATGAATVQRRNLVATDTESGTLSYASQQTVYNRLSGTITWVPQVGQVIRPGHALFTVDNKPVLLMSGLTPAYRDLTASVVSGPDVYELNRNLVVLGYNPDGIVVDDQWQSATTAGIDLLQHDLGETETGSLTLGKVVFLPGPQMIQTVDTTVGSTAASYEPAAGTSSTEFVDYSSATSDDATTGTTSTGSSTSTTGTGTSTTAGGTTITGGGTTTTSGTGTTGTTTTPTRTSTRPRTHGRPRTTGGTDNLSRQTLQQLMRLVRAQQRELQAEERASHSHTPSSSSNSPSSNDSGNNSTNTNSGDGGSGHSGNTGSGNTGSGSGNSGSGNSGGGGGGGTSATAVLSTSSTKLVVTVDLGASSQSEATIGERVTVEMPNGSTAGGHVTAVSPVAQSSSSGNGNSGSGGGGGGGGDGSGGSGTSTVPVTIVLNKPARGGGLDQASVSVNFVQSKAKHVLSVPVTALLATSGSTFAVQEAAPPHKLIPVQTGLFAAGYVEISGRGIYPGLQVTDSQG
jgi:hypothetical protein